MSNPTDSQQPKPPLGIEPVIILLKYATSGNNTWRIIDRGDVGDLGSDSIIKVYGADELESWITQTGIIPAECDTDTRFQVRVELNQFIVFDVERGKHGVTEFWNALAEMYDLDPPEPPPELEDKFDAVVYTDEEGKHARFEMEGGVKQLNHVAGMIGYEEQPFMFGSPLERMLADNPGMQEAMIEWLRDNCKSWEVQITEAWEELQAILTEEDNE